MMPLRRKAEMAVQLYKDFNFRVADGFEAEARKTLRSTSGRFTEGTQERLEQNFSVHHFNRI